MHNLILSAAEITTGTLWRAGPGSPRRMFTNTFRHSDWAKHGRSCLRHLLQLSKIPSQRAPITIIQKFNCGGSVNHLLCSWSAVSSQSLVPSVRLGFPGSPREKWALVPRGVHTSTALKPSCTTTRTKVISTYMLTSDLRPQALPVTYSKLASAVLTLHHSTNGVRTAVNPSLLA